jgi:hypothetical protein
VIKAERLDAILFPGAVVSVQRFRSQAACDPGSYPSHRAERADAPVPSGFNASGPFGASFTGMACSEPKLLETRMAPSSRRRSGA